MTDDIVTQLRFEYASCECSGIRHDCDRCETDKQAADEIEILNKVIELLIDELRQNGGYEAYTPTMIRQEFVDEVMGR